MRVTNGGLAEFQYNWGMATVYMSEAELSRNLHAALKQAQSGVDVVVELADRPVVIRASGRAGVAVRPPGRTVEECLAMARARDAARGYAATPDEGFAADVKAGIDGRRRVGAIEGHARRVNCRQTMWKIHICE